MHAPASPCCSGVQGEEGWRVPIVSEHKREREVERERSRERGREREREVERERERSRERERHTHTLKHTNTRTHYKRDHKWTDVSWRAFAARSISRL